jgi:hypothetical protein
LKYQDQRFDLIIAMDDWALEFMGAHRKEVSPDTPVVFFASSQSSQRIPNSAGVIGERNFSRTLFSLWSYSPRSSTSSLLSARPLRASSKRWREASFGRLNLE